MKKGKFVVIDGTDGSGKATQTKLLVDKLNSMGLRTNTIDFPRKDSFFGKLIYEALEGKYGDFKSLHPKLASVFWASDRLDASPQIEEWLNAGINVVADRYVSANQIHQGGKIVGEKERADFLEWLDYLEHKENKIPRPDLVCFLDVPFNISLRLMKARNETKKDEHPMRRKTDQHEQSAEHQIAARESAIKMLSTPSWVHVCCSEDGEELLSPEFIHQKVFDTCMKLF